jgi:hypothetical protein
MVTVGAGLAPARATARVAPTTGVRKRLIMTDREIEKTWLLYKLNIAMYIIRNLKDRSE